MKDALIGFNIGNFLSFKEIQNFSMIAGNDDILKDHIMKIGNINVLRSSYVYGANASGKSNFVKAILYSRGKILGINEKIIDNRIKINPDLSYSNQTTHDEVPSYFEYILAIGGKTYSYGFEIDTVYDIFKSEWLYELSINKDDLIFSLEYSETSMHDDSIQSLNDLLLKYRTTEMKIPFLKYISENKDLNDEFIKDIYDWFKNGLIVKTADFPQYIVPLKETYLNDLIRILQSFDIDISGYSEHEKMSIKIRSKDDEEFSETKIPDLSNPLYDDETNDSEFFSINPYSIIQFNKKEGKLINFEHSKNNFKIRYPSESLGTRRLIYILTLLMTPRIHESGKTIILDELECSLHTLLTEHLIELFNQGIFPCDQLIATTHEDYLLNPEKIRRDEVWFVDKDLKNNTGSHMYSLQSFNDDSKDYLESYLSGRYRAIPALKDKR